MLTRIMTAVIGIPLIILLVRSENNLAFSAVVLAVIILALKELFEIVMPGESAFGKWFAILMGCIVPVCVFAGIISCPESSPCLSPAPYAALVFSFIVFFFYQIVGSGDAETPFSDILLKFFGIFYVPVLLSYLLLINALPQGGDLILFLLFVTWAGDTGAYFTGTWFGKRPLAPSISPRKTVEGSLGSLFLSVVAAVLCQILLLNTFGLISCVVLGICVNILNQIGDLGESLIKRAYKVKDSGNMIPGHGGVLDRIDSLLFAVPFLYYYLKVLNSGI